MMEVRVRTDPAPVRVRFGELQTTDAVRYAGRVGKIVAETVVEREFGVFMRIYLVRFDENDSGWIAKQDLAEIE